MGLNQMPWFTSITEFMESSMDDTRKEDDSDQNILSVVINRTVVPRLTGDLDSVRITNTLVEVWRHKEMLYAVKSSRLQI